MLKAREIDMTNGPILKNLIICAIPLIIMNILQICFNAADIAVIGLFRGDDAVAAVGANASLINLITGLFIGMSTGANVVLAKYCGKQNEEVAKRVVGTSICISLISGIVLVIIGIFCAEYFLVWMGCPKEVLPLATKYLTIYLMGMPAVMLYNFLASILRAVGDTLSPMIFLFISGVVNVGLNVFFVSVCNMSVEGVAIATVVSQAISAICCLVVVLKSKGYSKFSVKYFRIYKQELKEIVEVGIPSGIQGCLFSLSNVFLQSAVNALGTNTMAANAVSGQLDSVVYFVGYSFVIACMSFVSQNYGAGKIDRIKKVIKTTMLVACVASFVVGSTVALLSKYLLRIMTNSEEVIAIAQIRLQLLGFTYFLCTTMEIFSHSMRALGKSLTSMVICLVGSCLLRIVYINTVYLLSPSFFMVYLIYPISWILTIITLLAFLIPQIKKIERKLKNPQLPPNQ